MEKHKFNYEIQEGASTLNILGTLPLMELDEIRCIESYLKKNHIMFEWGSGGSTLHFPKFVKKYYSVEYQLHWYRHIRNNLRKNKELNKKVKLYYVPCDMKYSYEDKNLKREWFSSQIEKIGNVGEKRFDIILVDGEPRSRVFCAEEALKYTDEDTILFIHDYYDRKELQEASKWYDVIDKAETLAVMRKK